jgi:hypothetical protein
VPNGADTETCCPVDEQTRLESKRRLGLPDRPTSGVSPNWRLNSLSSLWALCSLVRGWRRTSL